MTIDVNSSDDDVEQTFFQALQNHQAGHHATARAQYISIIRARPGLLEPRRLLASLLVQTGELAAGLAMLRQLLAVAPGNVNLLHDLADAEFSSGNDEVAQQHYQSVLEADETRMDAWTNLGNTLLRRGEFESALQTFKRAERLFPGNALILVNMGTALQNCGDLEEALKCFVQASSDASISSEALFRLGSLHLAMGRPQLAMESLGAAARSNPEHCASQVNLAKACLAVERPDEAVGHAQRATQIDPLMPEAQEILCAAHIARGEPDQALQVGERSIARNVVSPGLLNNLALASQMLGSIAKAEQYARSAIAANPLLAEAWDNLASCLVGLGRSDEAISCYQRSLELSKGALTPLRNLAIILRDQGDLQGAKSLLRLAQEGHPEAYEIQSLLLFIQQLDGELDPARNFEYHIRYGRNIESQVRVLPLAPRDREERRLRLGFVSGDFRKHAVSYFLEPLLKCIDKDRFEVFCYSNGPKRDEMTDKLRSFSNQWRSCYGLADELLAEQISNDQIDLLIDLSGHTGNNRLPVFAMKPAPVQLTWLGYSDTTGLSRIDYRLTDRFVSPVGDSEQFNTEKLVRLQDAFLCYGAPDWAPDVVDPPILRGQAPVFGCFNYMGKLSDQMLEAWSAILAAEKKATLYLKNRALADAVVRERLIQRMKRHRLDTERVEFAPFAPSVSEHLAHYSRVDLALDTFPYAGGTTTCEALWMGVPVVSLVGESYVSRMGLSLLENSGMGQLAVRSVEDYVQRSLELVSDPRRLADLRLSQRLRLKSQPLFMEDRFARSMEESLLACWQGRV